MKKSKYNNIEDIKQNIIINNSKIYPNGSIWDSNNYGKFKILEKLNYNYFLVEFEDGETLAISMSRIKGGNIKKINKITFDYNGFECVKNNSVVYYTGSKWKNLDGEYFYIINKSIDENYFICKFEDGAICKFQYSHIRNGIVKNPNKKTMHNTGFIGIGKYLPKNYMREYRLWSGIIQRGYSEAFKDKHSSYKDCTVDERWHSFNLFCEDMTLIENYDLWANDKTYQLDKDYKCNLLGLKNKIYSKDTCIFITQKENNSRSNRNQHLNKPNCIATRLSDGYKEIFKNFHEFAEKYNLYDSCIHNCIYKKQKFHKGWIFKILDIKENNYDN